jgi:hypothetical protein
LRRAATHRPKLEVLEDRRLLAFAPAVSYSAGLDPVAVVMADFNNDGNLDLTAGNPASGVVSVLLGDGRGSFGGAINSDLGSVAGVSRASLTVADFDNDGNLDLAAVTWTEIWGSNEQVSVLLGNGDGTFRTPTHPSVAQGPMSVAAGDFNNDGNSDLVVSEHDWDSFGYVEVLLGDGRGSFRRSGSFGYPGFRSVIPPPCWRWATSTATGRSTRSR